MDPPPLGERFFHSTVSTDTAHFFNLARFPEAWVTTNGEFENKFFLVLQLLDIVSTGLLATSSFWFLCRCCLHYLLLLLGSGPPNSLVADIAAGYIQCVEGRRRVCHGWL